jgi:hypothetical protein
MKKVIQLSHELYSIARVTTERNGSDQFPRGDISRLFVMIRYEGRLYFRFGKHIPDTPQDWYPLEDHLTPEILHDRTVMRRSLEVASD